MQILITFFFNTVSNLKIAEYANSDPISNNINDPVIKPIINIEMKSPKFTQNRKKYLRGSYSNKFPTLWNLSSRKNSVVFEEPTPHNIVHA